MRDKLDFGYKIKDEERWSVEQCLEVSSSGFSYFDFFHYGFPLRESAEKWDPVTFLNGQSCDEWV